MKDEYDFSKGVRGPVFPTPPGKTRITIRLDDEVLDWFRAKVHAMGGGNYQTLMNAALREHIAREEEPLEETLRRVIREELGTVAQAKDEMPQRIVRSKGADSRVAAERASNPPRA